PVGEGRSLPILTNPQGWRQENLPHTIPPANRRPASTRIPTPMRSSERSNQDARRSAFTPRCFPPRQSRWPALPPIGVRSSEKRAAWTPPARPPHASLLSLRRWHGEILTRRRFTWYCP